MSNFLLHGIKGDKTLFYPQISSVQLKPPGITTGYLQFSISGGNESTHGVFDAVIDENTIVFLDSQTQLAKAIVEFTENKIAGLPTPGAQDAFNTIQNDPAVLALLQEEERAQRCITIGCILIAVLPLAFLVLLVLMN